MYESYCVLIVLSHSLIIIMIIRFFHATVESLLDLNFLKAFPSLLPNQMSYYDHENDVAVIRE